MVFFFDRLQLRTACISLSLTLAGCSSNLDTDSVRAFIDAADQAFLDGHSADICRMRADDFTLSASEFELAKGKIVRSQSEAEAIEARSAPAGSRLAAETQEFDLQKFCLMALESKTFYKRATMTRNDLRIDVDPAGQSATVHAHYTVKEPVYEYQDSALHDRDTVEHQTATKQTESDDESVIVLGKNNEPVFKSTHSVSKSFLIEKERDRRL
jgi:hypothetical protein